MVAVAEDPVPALAGQARSGLEPLAARARQVQAWLELLLRERLRPPDARHEPPVALPPALRRVRQPLVADQHQPAERAAVGGEEEQEPLQVVEAMRPRPLDPRHVQERDPTSLEGHLVSDVQPSFQAVSWMEEGR